MRAPSWILCAATLVLAGCDPAATNTNTSGSDRAEPASGITSVPGDVVSPDEPSEWCRLTTVVSFDFLAKASPVDLQPRATSADGAPVVAFALGEIIASRTPSADETPFVAAPPGTDLAAWAEPFEDPDALVAFVRSGATRWFPGLESNQDYLYVAFPVVPDPVTGTLEFPGLFCDGGANWTGFAAFVERAPDMSLYLDLIDEAMKYGQPSCFEACPPLLGAATAEEWLRPPEAEPVK